MANQLTTIKIPRDTWHNYSLSPHSKGGIVKEYLINAGMLDNVTRQYATQGYYLLIPKNIKASKHLAHVVAELNKQGITDATVVA